MEKNHRIDLKPFEKKIWLSSPTMHGEELETEDTQIMISFIEVVRTCSI